MNNSAEPVRIPEQSRSILENMHRGYLEALRHREQEIFRYLAILGPALGGFIWMLIREEIPDAVFALGTIGVLLLLALGAAYALALGYNYRYIVLELAKLEAVFGAREAMLKSWPRSKADFLKQCRFLCFNSCTPPEVIKVFWVAFLLVITGVIISAPVFRPAAVVKATVIPAGFLSLVLCGIFLPCHYGRKFRDTCQREPGSLKVRIYDQE